MTSSNVYQSYSSYGSPRCDRRQREKVSEAVTQQEPEYADDLRG